MAESSRRCNLRDTRKKDEYNSTTQMASQSRKKRIHLGNVSGSSVADPKKRRMPLKEKLSPELSANVNAHSDQSSSELTNHSSDSSGNENDKSLTNENAMSDNNPTPNSGMVFLNVRGKLFQTTKDAISQYPGSFLDRLLDDNFSREKDETGAYIIDRDPAHFNTVLNYLQNSVLNLDGNKKVMKELFREADFYNIHSLVREIQKQAMKDLLCEAEFFKIEPLVNEIQKNISTMTINVILRNSGLGMVNLTVEKNYTVSTVKLMIDERDGIAPYQQRLFFRGKCLKKDKTLSYYNVQDGSTLTASYIRVLGSPPTFLISDPY